MSWSGKQRLLAGEDFLNAVGEGFPLVLWDIQGAEVEEGSVTRAVGSSDGLDEAVTGEGLIVAWVFLDDLLNEHKGSIAQSESLVNPLSRVWGTTMTVQLQLIPNPLHY